MYRHLPLTKADTCAGNTGRFPVSVASRTCLANLSWDLLVTWVTKEAEFFRLGEVAQSELYDFHS